MASADLQRRRADERPGASEQAPAAGSGPPPRLAARGLAARRGEREVLRGVSFDVAPGEIVGLLGPNGAGKSTLLSILTGLLAPDRGSVLLDGVELAPGGQALRARTGVVFQAPSLDLTLTCLENLVLGGRLFGMSAARARTRAAALLEAAGLEDRAREPAGRLSGGMRRRVELSRALVHRPSILLLDEPTSGLDAAAFRETWDAIDALRRGQGLTVLLTTHRPDEAERCDRLAVLARGVVVASDAPERLRARVRGDVVAVDAEEAEALAAEIEARLGLAAQPGAGGVLVRCERGHELVPRLVEAFPPGRFRAVSLRRPDLADAFLALTGEPLEERGATPESSTGARARTDAPHGPGRPDRPRSRAEPPTTRRRGAATRREGVAAQVAEPAQGDPGGSGAEPPRMGPAQPRRARSARQRLSLATVRVLVWRDLVRFFRQPSRLAGALGQPILFWLVIGSGMAATFRMPGSDIGYLEYFYPGVTLMIVLFAAIFTTASVIEDRHQGFLQAVLTGPGSRSAVVLGKSLGSAAVALSQAALFLPLAPLAGFAPGRVDWPLLAAALGLAAFALAALGFAIAWVVDNVQGYHAIQMTLLVPLWIVSGAMFPPSDDHPGFRVAMQLDPVAYAVSAARRALGGPGAPGALPGTAATDLAALALFAAAALGAALLSARRRP